MKVYIVMLARFGEGIPYRVFMRKSKAEEYVKQLQPTPFDYYIEEHGVVV